MLKAMRETAGGNSLVPPSLGEDIYTGMLDNEYAKLFAMNGSLGLSDLIVKEIERRERPGTAQDGLAALRTAAAPWAADPRFIPRQSGLGVVGGAAPKELADRLVKWESLIDGACARSGVDKHLVSAIIAQESGGNPFAVSPKGAKGLMQLMDSTAAELGVSAPFSPRANVDGGTKYLRFLLDKFGGDERLAVASYNAGPAAVEKYGGVPPYEETRRYVDSVLALRRRFEQLSVREER